MSNQMILWSMAILPWFTIFFMKKEDIKRFMPIAFLTIVSTGFVIEAGNTLNLWKVRETIYPLNQTISYVYGLAPVVAMWVFKLAYGRIWLFIISDLVFNIVFSFLIVPWLAIRGIKDLNVSNLTVLLIATVLSIPLYLYQMWQEDALVPAVKKFFAPKLQPALNKPLIKEDDKTDNK